MDWLREVRGKPAEVIAGRKVVQGDLLADGGYAYVYAGSDARSGEKLAIRRELLHDQQAVQKAHSEIALLQRIEPHPHIVRFIGGQVLAAGAASGRSGTQAVSLFELCPGGTLLARLNKQVAATGATQPRTRTVAGSTRSVAAAGGGQAPRERPPVCCPCLQEAEALEVLGGTAAALAHLHRIGVVHYDVKSENLLLGADGKWKLGDFGSASDRTFQLAGAPRRLLLEAEEFIHGRCTPIYRPPEVADVYQRLPIGPKVDIFALGCVLFATVAGVHPFPTDSALANIQAKFEVPPEAPSSYSEATLRWVRRLLAREPDQRPAAAQLEAEVRSFLARGECPPNLAQLGAAAAAAGQPAASEAAPSQPAAQWVADFSTAPPAALAAAAPEWVADFSTPLSPNGRSGDSGLKGGTPAESTRAPPLRESDAAQQTPEARPSPEYSTAGVRPLVASPAPGPAGHPLPLPRLSSGASPVWEVPRSAPQEKDGSAAVAFLQDNFSDVEHRPSVPALPLFVKPTLMEVTVPSQYRDRTTSSASADMSDVMEPRAQVAPPTTRRKQGSSWGRRVRMPCFCSKVEVQD